MTASRGVTGHSATDEDEGCPVRWVCVGLASNWIFVLPYVVAGAVQGCTAIHAVTNPAGIEAFHQQPRRLVVDGPQGDQQAVRSGS